jgi:predicted DNA binding CopG/RHH family protein
MTQKRDTNLTIRVSPQEKLAWQEKAAYSAIPLSSLIRQAMSKTNTWTIGDR